MTRDRLDIEFVARELERRINRPKYRHGSSMKAAFIRGGNLYTYGADTRSYDYYLTHHARHCVGVYCPGVTLDELRDDLAVVL